MRIRIVRISIGLMLSIALVGCSTTQTKQDLMTGIKPNSVVVSNAISDDFKKSTQHFSIELFKNSIENGQNTLVSPTSVVLALGMTANGASGETLNAFKSLLGNNQLSLDELNKTYKAYAQHLTQNQDNVTLTIANSIWYKTGFTPETSFLQTNADFYRASARALNFKGQTDLDTINHWVKERTNNKIDQIVQEFKPNDVMYLINAFYFDAKWPTAFTPEPPGEFLSGDGTTTQLTQFMSVNSPKEFIQDESASAVLLPYSDNHFAFLAILPGAANSYTMFSQDESTVQKSPDKEITDYIASMDEKTIPDLMSKMKSTGISIMLPKFKVLSSKDIATVLQKMGLGSAFNPEKADFSKMGKRPGGLSISSVPSKIYIDVNYTGTEAAAVTAPEMVTQSAHPTLMFNRPFIYAIIDTETNLPLMLGVMEKPEVYPIEIPQASK